MKDKTKPTKATNMLDSLDLSSYEEQAGTLIEQLKGEFESVFESINKGREPEFEDLDTTLILLTRLGEELSIRYESE